MNKNILVASYYFPPHPGIGGRRMAKFCKYLVKKGYTIHVIKVENPYAETSQWYDEVCHPNIKTYSLPLSYPKTLIFAFNDQGKKRTVFEKIRYKLTHLFYTTIQKKRVYDPTFLWEKQFTEFAGELIQKFDIKNFIVSVSPYYYSFFAAKLKKKYPDLNLIIDFRDPWINMRDYGMQAMTPKQKMNEQQIIAEVVQNADYLISPSAFALDEFKPYTKKHDRFIEIPHGFDWDDIKEFIEPPIEKSIEKSKKIKFIYPGTLYTDILPSLLKLNDVLDYLKINSGAVYSKLEFDFYADELNFAEFFKEHAFVRFNKPIGKKIFEKAEKSTVILILYAEHNKNYRTTKFFEFLPFKKNYLYIGPQGDTYDFIKKNQLGFSFDNDSEPKIISETIINIAANNIQYTPLIDSNEYSFEYQTGQLIRLFK